MNARDLYIAGLKNAHAMENQAHEILERQIERMSDYPELHQRLQQHLGETKQQLKRLEQCLAQIGGGPSTIKDAVLAFGSNLAAMGHAMAGDEVLKNAFANSGLEHYEIAAYKALLALAEEAGLSSNPVLRQSLNEEEEMAAWIDAHVETITRQFIRMEERTAA